MKTKTRKRKPERRLPIKPTFIIIPASLIITLIVDALARRSVQGLFDFIAASPLTFAINWAVVAFTYAIAMMFRKKAFSFTLATVAWLILGIVDNSILSRRTGLPLSAGDLEINMDAILMMPIFYSWLQIALYTLAGVAVFALLVWLYIKTPRYIRDIKSSFLRLLSFALILTILLLVGFERGSVSRNLKPSLYDAYQKYGFPYGFAWSFFDTGIDMPDSYSPSAVQHVAEGLDISVDSREDENETFNHGIIENFREYLRTGEFSKVPENYTAESVETIRSLIKNNEEAEENIRPNIIFLQLEAFCDPTRFTNYSITGGDPIEFFRSASEKYPSGKLHVPTVSGGTANTEFEVLTGCNLDFFGSNEFPFYSVLKEHACESIATDLKLLGYRTAFMHTYSGSFYYRNEVYDNLDFDNFVSIEYMNGYDTTPTGWARDSIMEKYIMEAMQSSEEPDMIYAVTVQTHGAYTAEPDRETGFTVETIEGEDAQHAMEYYLYVLSDTDAFLKELTNSLSDYDEPVMLVIYGDHLPGLRYEAENIIDGDMFSTNYLIWANFPLEPVKRDIEAYQLSSYALEMCGLNPGVMVRFHQTQKDKPDYFDNMKILEYDLMYGKHFMYNGHTLVRTNEMQYGLSPIIAESVQTVKGHLFVHGNGFTMSSRIQVGGSGCDTIFVDEHLIIAANTVPESDEAITVAQVAADGFILSETEGIYLQ